MYKKLSAPNCKLKKEMTLYLKIYFMVISKVQHFLYEVQNQPGILYLFCWHKAADQFKIFIIVKELCKLLQSLLVAKYLNSSGRRMNQNHGDVARFCKPKNVWWKVCL